MRRRAVESRRLPRRRLSGWIWFLFAISALAALVLLTVSRGQVEKTESLFLEANTTKTIPQNPNFNLTKDLLSSTSFARQLADQTTLAKAYLVIAKEHHNFKFAGDLSLQIRNAHRLLSRAAIEGKTIIQSDAESIISNLSQLIYKAQDMHYDLATIITTLRTHSLALEERVKAAIVQTVVFGRLMAKSVPKYIHCLTVKLTDSWSSNPALKQLDEEQRSSPRISDNSLYHLCLFSDNVLAAAVVVNSTVLNANHPQQLVFHIVTGPVNYRAMKAWFLGNNFGGALVEVLSTEEFSWLNSVAEEIQKSLRLDTGSLLSHLRFYIPQILPALEKVVFLEDDVVVQKDLTMLFSLDLHKNINGAVETCLETFHRYQMYLNFSNPLISLAFDPETCGWAFGVNVFDLVAWREANLTAKYQYWLGMNANHSLWTEGILPLGLLTFYGSTEPLDRRWHVLGLGYDPEIDERLIETAAVVHFNGNLKPWLGSAITKYRPLWEKYVNHTHLDLHGCVTNR